MTLNEAKIEEVLIERLKGLKYTYRRDIRDRESLEQNFRKKFEVLNQVNLTNAELKGLRKKL